MATLLIKNATVVTINPDKDILNNTDILICNGIIKQIDSGIQVKADKVIDAKDRIVLPGFIQTHVHLCQTIFRGLAENRELLFWLREKIWPFEAAHDENSTYYSAMLGIGEMISGGTTTILDMGGVNHTDKLFEAISQSGIRAFCGKAMMDTGIEVPKAIMETTENSINESMNLYQRWNGKDGGRIRYAFAPRFILSVSDNLFNEIKYYSEKYNILVHTHAYENNGEGAEVLNIKGMREFEYFNRMGLLNSRLLAAHCVWADENDIRLMKENHVKVLHCPSSNFKLGSGMLDLAPLIKNGINVSIGADGAPCNNNLDMLHEIRTTALMQNIFNKPGTIEAHKYLELATIEGAKALGIDKEVGSIELNKKADLIVMDLENDYHSWHSEEADIPTRIVYSSKNTDIKTVIIDGNIIMENQKFLTLNKNEILDNAKIEVKKLIKRGHEI